MIGRREFLALIAAARLSGKTVKVERLFRSPDGHPNGLETAREGFWIGEQTTDRAYLVDWKGKVLKKVDTESSNTSGIAFGDGCVWMAANGKAVGRAPRLTDATTGEVVKVDPATGKTLARYPVPGGGGVHGLEFTDEGLWVTSLRLQKLSLVDPKDFRVIRQIPVHLQRAHGLAWDPPGIWCMHSTDRVIHKLDAHDGHILDTIALSKDAPDPHGMCLARGHLYYCDAGIAPQGKSNDSPHAGYVCRIDAR